MNLPQKQTISNEELLTNQAKIVFELVKNYSSIPPSEFRMTPVMFSIANSLAYVSELQHLQTNFYFRFGKANPARVANWDIILSPGYQNRTDQIFLENWRNVEVEFINWIQRVQLEASINNPWKEFTQADTATEWMTSDDKLTSKEKANLMNGLADVKQYLIDKFGEDHEAIADINQLIKELPSQLNKLSKKDVGLFIATFLIQKGADWGLTQEHIRTLLHIILSHLVTIGLIVSSTLK